jgi:acetyl-CoA carboxylase biotin carboxyl carrier protein
MNTINKTPVTAENGSGKTPIDYDEIKRLIALLEEKNLTDFELEIEGFKIKISRNVPAAPVFHAVPAVPAPAANGENPAAPASSPAVELDKNSRHILSPMVGTFYRAPAPNADPFVEIGDPVKKGQTLCIIEAMKLMNEIECDIDGVLEAIHVENAKPVEFSQKLFTIRAAD